MKRPCFTLIELLVVIAIVALLLAILTVVMNSVRRHARALKCSSRIRSLTFALIMYENKHEAFPYGLSYNPTPPQGGYVGDVTQDAVGWWWFNFLDDYVKKSNKKTTVFNCPSKQLNHPRLKENVLCGNYGVNLSICKISDDIPLKKEFIGTPLGDEDIPNPSQTLLIVDSGYTIISWWHATDVPPVVLNNSNIEDTAYVPGLKINNSRSLLPGQKDDANEGRHPNKTVNVGFVDGSVARRKADDLLVEKEGNNYRNRSPLWVPE